MRLLHRKLNRKIYLGKSGVLLSDRNGFAAILLALTLIPLLTVTGIAIEYGQMSQGQATLNSAADSAALVATTTAANAFIAGQNPNYIAAGQAAGTAWFNSEIARLGLPTPSAINIQIAQSTVSFTTSLTYQAQMPTNFGGFFGKKYFSINGASSAVINIPGNLDIHILMDVSSSMNILASPNDNQTWFNLMYSPPYQAESDTQAHGGACEFACHYQPLGTEPDLYDIAEQNGIQLRIDLLRNAVENVIQTMVTSASGTNFRVGLYEFNTTETTLAAISSNLSAAYTTAQQISTPVTTKHGDDTDFEAAMSTMTGIIENANNNTQNSHEVLFIITDGVDDNNDNSSEYNSFNPAACSELKSKGVRIEILYTQYYTIYSTLPSPSDPTGALDNKYQNGVLPILGNVIPALQACASSPSDVYVATDGTSVNNALQTMLQASQTTPGRYTK